MIDMPTAKCLSFHAAYRCRSTGACCSAGWTIPFSPSEFQGLAGLALSRASFVPLADGVMAAGVRDEGPCTFLEDGARLCEIHRLGGQAALPLTCRMFPRIVLHDPRGTFISLSHFCPTAAALLFEAGPPAAIVDAPGSLTGIGELDGLDAREVWAPLLRPGVLMDHDSYGAWERLAVELLTRDGVAPGDSVTALDAATDALVAWTPGSSRLLDAVHDAFESTTRPSAAPAAHDRAVNRWLAARLFGTWIAYQGEGLRTIVRYLRACLASFQIELARDGDPLEAIRRCDRLIVHDASSQRIATLLNDAQ